MQASAILAQTDRMLFPERDETKINAAFRKLAKVWHPDRCKDPDASHVFAHITEMHRRALGRGAGPHRMFVRSNGTQFRMEYMRSTTGEGCDIFVGQTSVAYLVGSANADLSNRAMKHKWRFENDTMKKEMERFLPRLVRVEDLDGGRLFIFRRTPDQILMRDLIDLTPGRIDPPHVSWMVTRMNNIACYLEYAGISHLAMSPENLLVSLTHHAVSLTGPALYVTPFGERPKAAPKRTLGVIPEMTRKDFVCDSSLDRRLVRHNGMELLGDPSGNRIRTDKTVRPDVAQWLATAPAKTAVDDYAAWEASLGERKFVIYPKTAEEIYSTAN